MLGKTIVMSNGHYLLPKNASIDLFHKSQEDIEKEIKLIEELKKYDVSAYILMDTDGTPTIH